MNCGTFISLATGIHGVRGGDKQRTYFKAEYEMDQILRNLHKKTVPSEKVFNPQS
jgi:hypothetical protein